MGFSTLSRGQRDVTVVVAAVNSSPAGRANADLLCDGVDDQVQINDALSSEGVSVILLEGTYTISGSILLRASQTLQGQGNSSIVRLRDGHNTSINMFSMFTPGQSNITLKNFTIDGRRFQQAATSGQRALHMLPNTNNFTFIDMNVVNIGAHSITVFDAIDRFMIKNCRFDSNFSCLFLGSLAVNTLICNSFFFNSVDIGLEISGDRSVVTGCFIVNNTSGVFFNSNSHSILSNNYVFNNTRHGINLSGSSGRPSFGNQIVSNISHSNGRATHNTFSNIFLSEFCNEFNVQNNVCRQGSNANLPAFGIRVNNANCNNNLITNNDLLNSGVSGSLSNLGTGTITLAGNRPAV